MKEALLIYPPLGSDDVFIKDVPLSLVYAASSSAKNKFPIKILDLRLYPNWEKELKKYLTDQVMLIGLSVLTGNPIRNAMAITDFIKNNSLAKVVWGGHHPTMEPESTMKFDKVDFLIRGFGSESLRLLISELNKHAPNFSRVPGLSYRIDNDVIHNKVKNEWEMIGFRDIPYHLIEDTFHRYNRFSNNERLMPIFTSFGCPYKCAFCMAPVMYKDMEKKWVSFEIEEIIDHIKYLITTFNITAISVYDDDSFININYTRNLLEKIIEEKVNLKIDFRGARINELDSIGEDFFKLMVKAGVIHFQVGLESGSQKVLDIMNKKINYEQIIRVNEKLAKFASLVPIYNLMTGVPDEDYDDLKKTKDLVLRLYRDNKNCIIGFPAKFKPLPGTALYDIAVKRGLERIDSLEGWSNIDTADSDMFFPWYTKKYNMYINMFQIASLFIDNKILKEIPPASFFNRLLRIIAIGYRPIALLRLKYDFYLFNFEFVVYKFFRKFVRKIAYGLCNKP